MASSVSSSTPVPSAAGQTARAEDKFTVFIDRRLRLTGNHVKLVDLFGGLMMLCGFVLASLLLLCVVDAWVFELNAALRIIALLGILLASGGYFLIKLLPLLIHRINPAYAAKMIEDGHPELKNSLLNHVFFQRDPRGAKPVVAGAVHRKAAEDISRITIETAVDRGFLIRAGYFFAGALALFGLYKVLSPKDPFTTVARIAAPFAEIARPSRVFIDEIKPGDVEIFFGERLNVEARITGIGNDEPVSLVFSSEDGQIADRRLSMKRGEDGRSYSSELSSGNGGVQQNLTYWIKAGDGQSRTFKVIVKPQPSFVVQSVEIAPPAYTQLEPYVQQQGNVAGVEGARVMVRALANLPIDVASIHLLALPESDDQHATDPTTAPQLVEPQFVESVSMRIENESEAVGEFWLQMHNDRLAPRYTHYRVGFRTKDGVGNENATVYRIQTTPDLKPEIELLQPQDTISQLPENRSAEIEVRAFDPDYQLSDIRLVGDRRGSHLFEKSILRANTKTEGQIDVAFQLNPREFGLRAGDEILIHALALDNRHAPASDVLDPNLAKSKQIRIQITPAVEKPAGSDSSASGENQQDDPQNQDQNQADSQQPNENQPSESGRGAAKTTAANEQQQADGDSSKDASKSGESSKESSKDNAKTDSQQKSDQSKSGDSQQQESGGGNAKSEGSQQDSAQSKGKGNAGGGKSSGDQSKQGRQPKQGSGDGKSEQNGDPQKSGEKSGDPANSGENSSPSGNGNSQSKPKGQGGEESGDQQAQDGSGNGSDANSDPVDHPGDAFERLKERVEQLKKERGQDSARSNAGEGQAAKSDQAEQSGRSGTGDERQESDTKPERVPDGSRRQNSDDEKPGEARKDDSKQGEPSKDSAGSKHDGSKQEGSKQDGDKQAEGKQDDGEKGGSKKDSTDNSPGEAESGGSGKNGSKKDQLQDKTGGDDNVAKGVDQESPKQDGSQAAGTGKDKKGEGSGVGQEEKEDAAGKQGDEQRGSATETGDEKSGDEKSGSSANKNDSKQSQQDASGQQNGRDETKGGEKSPAGGERSKSGKADSRQNGKKQQESGNEQADAVTDSSGQSTDPADENAGERKPDGARQSSQSAAGAVKPGSGAGDRQRGDRGRTADVADESPAGDEANLEYARKATDLVLDYLKDQKDEVDERLLDDLNWSPAEMRDFYEKWELMRRQAEQGGAAERKRYEEALRSLGLRPGSEGVEGENIQQQKIGGLLEKGNRSQPPAHLLEEFRSFNKGRKRGEGR